jgi:hypothetical protein
MRLAIAVLLATSAYASGPCLIVKHATASQQVWVSGANWRYVEGDFPAGIKWKSNITDRGIRQIKERGGKVVIVPEKYSTPDLEDARKQCGAPQTEVAK